MKKTAFQLSLAGYLFALSLFVSGLTVLLLLNLKTQEAFSSHFFSTILILIPIFFSIILLLCAAIQIYRTGKWSILKVLLYASIPKFNLMGYLIYEFYFFPYFYTGAQFNQLTSKLSLLTKAGFYLPFLYNYEITIDGDGGPLFLISINIASIVIIKLLNKYYSPRS